MKTCDDIRSRIGLYLDDELSGHDKAGFEAHLTGCMNCLRCLQEENDYLETVRTSRPLYSAPSELRSTVLASLDEQGSGVVAPERLRRQITRIFLRSPHSTHAKRPLALILSTAAVAAFLLLAGWLLFDRLGSGSGSSEFALMAVSTHLRHQRGQLPLEVVSHSPEEISNWFSGKVPFSLRLPNYQEESGQEKLYELEGARLVGFKNDYAAYVAYNTSNRPISLVVTSSGEAVPSGGEEIQSRNLTFHFDSIDGLKVITWSDHGLTYALVSDLEERGQQSCVVCHQGTRDRDFIEGLKPRSNP